jgi:hypothetical protein
VEQLNCGTTSFSHHPLDQRLFWNTKHSIRNKNYSNAASKHQISCKIEGSTETASTHMHIHIE